MQTPQLEPKTTAAPTSACFHQRLIERIRSEDKDEPSRFRCLECGGIVDNLQRADRTT
jgi:hypothetical protein